VLLGLRKLIQLQYTLTERRFRGLRSRVLCQVVVRCTPAVTLSALAVEAS